MSFKNKACIPNSLQQSTGFYTKSCSVAEMWAENWRKTLLKISWFIWLGVYAYAWGQTHPRLFFVKKEPENPFSLQFSCTEYVASGKSRPASLPEKKFHTAFLVTVVMTCREGQDRTTNPACLGASSGSSCCCGTRASRVVALSQLLVWDECSQRGCIIIPTPPKPSQTGVHFMAFLQVIAISREWPKMKGEKKKQKKKQFPVFVIIIGYIYRKKVN